MSSDKKRNKQVQLKKNKIPENFKHRINVTVDRENYLILRTAGINISSFINERMGREAKRIKVENWKADNLEGMRELSQFIAKYNSFSDENRIDKYNSPLTKDNGKKKWQKIGYYITRGFLSPLSYNEITQKWHQDPLKATMYNNIEDALTASSKIEKYKKNIEIREAIDKGNGSIGLMTLGGLEGLENIKKLIAP
ncbi:type II toxin-antitoxin system CcdA family antitoxin [Xenorhabdus stockiae]|uniref:type II toxin-antitoxin system CcdA family antitoxin n=1 Tax=Xenorhabdus stockiae TaxID=351614 RepID=UPI003CEA754B